MICTKWPYHRLNDSSTLGSQALLYQRQHRRRKIRPPAAKVQALRGARLKALLALDFCLCIRGCSCISPGRAICRRMKNSKGRLSLPEDHSISDSEALHSCGGVFVTFICTPTLWFYVAVWHVGGADGHISFPLGHPGCPTMPCNGMSLSR